MLDEGAQAARESAAQINELILDLWIASERDGPSYDEFELTSQQHAVLSLIVTQPGMSPRALSEALAVTKGAISQHLGVLERDGYISRRRSERDGGVQVIQLEARGQEYRDCMQRFEQYAIDRYLAKLSADDLTGIVAALKKLKSAFDD